nr:putative integron gene cassette protein [uncultured bacterium]
MFPSSGGLSSAWPAGVTYSSPASVNATYPACISNFTWWSARFSSLMNEISKGIIGDIIESPMILMRANV